ncbi:AAA family ATPase [Methylocystis sp. IM4]|uniref:AAA family ATPase n=1 Tax=Methylocystis sp. IM4 TaxID=3136560 RepID=UPI004053571E
MRLDRIEIENFKGIGERQSIELRPITLLFGPNSAGKSTILQALHYVREIMERGNIDPDVTIAGGLIDLGGFATLVHNHELHRIVRLKLSLDLSVEQEYRRFATQLRHIVQRAGIQRTPIALSSRGKRRLPRLCNRSAMRSRDRYSME